MRWLRRTLAAGRKKAKSLLSPLIRQERQAQSPHGSRQPEEEHQGAHGHGAVSCHALPASIFVLSGLPVSALREDHIGAYLGSPLPYQRPGWRLVAGLGPPAKAKFICRWRPDLLAVVSSNRPWGFAPWPAEKTRTKCYPCSRSKVLPMSPVAHRALTPQPPLPRTHPERGRGGDGFRLAGASTGCWPGLSARRHRQGGPAERAQGASV